MDEKKQFIIGLLSSLSAGGFLIWATYRLGMKRYSTADFVNPLAVAEIAESLSDRTEDEFIRAAWQFVSDNIQYENKGSDLYFVADAVQCRGCYLPLMTLKRSMGNCVAKSALLASILRNRIPPERVFMAVGEISFDGIGGHSWIEVKRQDGNWYIIEATKQPGNWARADSLASYYLPMSLMNDRYFNCSSSEICKVRIGKCQIS